MTHISNWKSEALVATFPFSKVQSWSCLEGGVLHSCPSVLDYHRLATEALQVRNCFRQHLHPREVTLQQLGYLREKLVSDVGKLSAWDYGRTYLVLQSAVRTTARIGFHQSRSLPCAYKRGNCKHSS